MSEEILMNRECKAYLQEHFEEVDTFTFYDELFAGDLCMSEDAAEYANHGHISLTLPRIKGVKLWGDFAALVDTQGKDIQARMSPASYIGSHRTNKNARRIYAIAIDVDHLQPKGTEALFKQIDGGYFPLPTFTVWSGRGMHLYYVFDRPINAYETNRRALQRYKTELSRRLLNRYVTERWGSYGSSNAQEIEQVLQEMRIVGSGTKDGSDIARAYRTGKKVSIDYLNRPKFVPKEARIKISAGSQLATAALKYPQWFMRMSNGEKPHYWHVDKAVYRWWLDRVRSEAVNGHRYFAVMCLAIYAKKCDVPLSELEHDAYELMKDLDALTVNGEHFTERDVKAALRAYRDSYNTFPNHWISTLSAIPITPNRRNGRKQRDHLQLARIAKEQHKKNGSLRAPEGRPDKGFEVASWRAAHPDGTKSQCKADTGISYPTIRKYWELPLPIDTGKPLESLGDLTEYMSNMNMQELRAFMENHGDEISK